MYIIVTMYVYIIQLEDEHFFVGSTFNPQFSMSRHFNAAGSPWTSKYAPIKIIEFIPECDEYDEDKYVRKYMAKYGIDRVRGGSFCDEVLPDAMRCMLEDGMRATENVCDICSQKGHLMKNCVTKICNEVPETIDDLLDVVERHIQKRKQLEIVDMSDNNMIDTWCKILALEANAKVGTPQYDALYSINHKYGFPNHDYSVSQILHFETERAREERNKNELFLPMIEALYNVVKKMNKK
jgi:predicted GIY-YIG superfamily endonuclease